MHDKNHGLMHEGMFKGCAFKDCIVTYDRNYFGIGTEDKFDAIITLPGDFNSPEVSMQMK
jgi:hypothetical protein